MLPLRFRRRRLMYYQIADDHLEFINKLRLSPIRFDLYGGEGSQTHSVQIKETD